MDLSIRVIAINTSATRVASHQGTHTYRLSKFLKINPHHPTAAKRWNYEAPTIRGQDLPALQVNPRLQKEKRLA
jgi:hypothetical protein